MQSNLITFVVAAVERDKIIRRSANMPMGYEKNSSAAGIGHSERSEAYVSPDLN